jgi:hypothetical protein
LSASLSITFFQLRHRHAARDAHVLQHVIELWLLVARHFAPAGDGVDHRLMKFPGDQHPQRGSRRDERCGIEQVAEGGAQQPIERGVATHGLADQCAGVGQQIDEEEQADQQQNGAAAVRLDVGVETEGGHGGAFR